MELYNYIFKKRITSTYLAKKLGITRPYLCKIIRYTKCPSVSLAKKIEEAIDGEIPWTVIIQNYYDHHSMKNKSEKKEDSGTV